MPGGQRVYIGNIGNDIRDRDVEKFFKSYGKLGDISIKNGYGFVDFDDYRDAEDAVQDLDGKDLRGSRLESILSIFLQYSNDIILEFALNWLVKNEAIAMATEIVEEEVEDSTIGAAVVAVAIEEDLMIEEETVEELEAQGEPLQDAKLNTASLLRIWVPRLLGK